MKSYLVVFFVLWSFSGFGQHGCYFEFCHPENGLNFFYKPDYFFNNHFQEFFPAERIKRLNIKSVMIHSEYEADVPSIHVQQEPMIKFNLNENGFVEYFSEINDVEYFYNRRTNGEIITKKYLSHNYDGDTNTMYYEYDSSKMIVKDDLIESVKEYFFDVQNRVSTYIYYSERNDYDTTFYNYDESNLTLTEIINYEDVTTIRIVTFNHKWQPIKEHITMGNIVGFESNYIYDDNLLVEYNFFILRPKEVQNENGEWIEETPWDISTYVKENHQSNFYYNENSLLEKITQTTDQGTCEYRVYYYTE